MLETLRLEWQRLSELLSKYHDEPIFLPKDYITGKMLPSVFTVAVACTLIYALSLHFASRFIDEKSDSTRKAKIGYQITNSVFNLCVGLLGLYIEYWVLPSHPISNAPVVERAVGLADETYWLSALQLGYQVWAIPVGLFQVHESVEMILHHFAVVVSTSMSGFMTIGFRYYISFFYGVMELSSLPLSAMNAFKEHPEFAKKVPKGLRLSRTVFAISFLWIRVFLCAYKWPLFLRDNFIILCTREMGAFKFFLLVQWSLAAFLAYLQLFWGTLIVKGVVKMILGKEKKKKA